MGKGLVGVQGGADFVWGNGRLARPYELAPGNGSYLRNVKLPKASPYGGLLRQAASLKVTANGSTTSPVVRGGRWILSIAHGLSSGN